MQVLTWNLFHGRAQPPAGRDLLADFAEAIAGWAWDVALLQEVPPWWPRPLGERSRASARMALTSRNLLLPLRRFAAVRWPDAVRSSGGGCNAILVRGRTVVEHRSVVLTCLPERRVMHAVRLDDGTWVANAHASKQEPRARTERDIARAVAALEDWTAGAPRVVFGGDLNVPDPDVPGFAHISWHGVDHVYARGFERDGRGRVLDPRPLSDHRPVLARLRPVA